jgi:hypothetical protein
MIEVGAAAGKQRDAALQQWVVVSLMISFSLVIHWLGNEKGGGRELFLPTSIIDNPGP